MSDVRGIYAIWRRELLRFWRDKTRAVGSITFPLLFLLVFGVGLKGVWAGSTQFLFPGIIGMTVLMSSFMAGVSVVWEREFGFLKEVLVAPISRVSFVWGKVLGGATVAMMQGIVVLLFAPAVGVSLSPLMVLQLLPLMFLVAAALGALGILIASRMKSIEAFGVVMNMVMFPMIFLSGVFLPVDKLPSWMSVLVRLNPVTYGVDPLRQVMLHSTSEAVPLTLFGHPMTVAEEAAIVAAFGVAMILLGMWSFSIRE
jgi:ABC-2 type transport system permease protein